jgi:arabinose-5-phosphate isomerase
LLKTRSITPACYIFAKSIIIYPKKSFNWVMQHSIKQIALRTIALEAAAVKALENYITEDFETVVHSILTCTGRLVISGIGKSAIVAQKIVATLNSTGTASLFMHAADAIHGDLGMIQQNDIVLIISKSGDSPEIKVLVPLVKHLGNQIIAMVGNTQSFLATNATYVLNTTIQQEACPNNLAPTSSTTAQLVMGDALAICLMEQRGFTSSDFAKFHPGGTIGKKLYLTVADIYNKTQQPKVSPHANMKDVIVEISNKRLGATAVVNDTQELIGIITDGDLRRMLEKEKSLTTVTAQDVMNKNPKTIQKNSLAVDALDVLRKSSITQLAIVNEQNKYEGIIHLHDIIVHGIV